MSEMNPGTDPAETPVADGNEAEPNPTTDDQLAELRAQVEELQRKHEADLQRITPLEEERNHLRSLIDQQMGARSTGSPGSSDEDDMAAFEQSLVFTAGNPNATPAERQAAKWLLGFGGMVRSLPRSFDEKIALAPLDVATRAQVKQVISEAAKAGSHITPEFARDLINLRAAQAENAKLKAAPAVPPPNTRVVPSPVPPAGANGTVTFSQLNAEWPTATPQRKDELRAMERAGKVVPG